MPKRILQGAVVSDANDKTITVLVERRFMHPMVKKVVRRSKKYRAHDENNTFKVGDIVRIEECRLHWYVGPLHWIGIATLLRLTHCLHMFTEKQLLTTREYKCISDAQILL